MIGNSIKPPERQILYEVFFFFLLSLLLLQITGFFRIYSTFIDKISHFLTAGIFFILPFYIFKKRNLSFLNFGLNVRGFLKDIFLVFIVSIIVFAFFIPGFFFYNSFIFGKNLVKEVKVFKHWPVDFYYRPQKFQKQGIYFWIENEEFYLLSTIDKSTTLKLRFETAESVKLSEIFLKNENLFSKKHKIVKSDFSIELQKNKGFKTLVSKVSNIEIKTEGEKKKFFAGIDEKEIIERSLKIRKNFFNFIYLIFFQIIFIGLPEEFFYRGYIQTRLNFIFHKKWKFFGTYFGPSLILTSALFAIGHFIMEPYFQRLSVFFSSFLFGWMREKSSGIYGVGIFHGLCNVLIWTLQRFY